MRKPTLLDVCMHEAGHAVVQLATGPTPWIDYIEVDQPDETRLGIVWTEAMWHPWMRDEHVPAEVVQYRRRLAIRDVVNFLAGDIAEMRWRRCQRYWLQSIGQRASTQCLQEQEPDANTDFGRVRNRLEWLMPGQEKDGFLRAWAATEGVVAAWWREIERLGRELAERGRMEDEHIYPLWNDMRDARGKAALRRAARMADWLEPS